MKDLSNFEALVYNLSIFAFFLVCLWIAMFTITESNKRIEKLLEEE
jgi:hypothetical protein